MAGLFKRGLIHIYYGDGKGKTSAAAGLAVRVSGSGGRALFTQFLKNGKSGELAALKKLDSVEVVEGKPCLKFVKDMSGEERAEAARGQSAVLRLAADQVKTGEYDLLVLDEITDAVDLALVDRDELIGLLTGRPTGLEIVLTGHTVIPELLALADYASEIKKVKHPYDRGVKARRGVEF